MTSHPRCPIFPKEIKAEVLKAARQKYSVCIALSPRCLKVISDCEVLFLSPSISLQNTPDPTDESSEDCLS